MIDPASIAQVDAPEVGTWTDDVILAVACGRCGAVPGEHCTDRNHRAGRSHLARWRAWCAQNYRDGLLAQS